MTIEKKEKFILWFDEVGIEDIPLVGGKNASLGEMYRELTKKKVNIPFGFAITAKAYKHFIEFNHLNSKIESLLANLDVRNINQLEKIGNEIRHLILNSTIPFDLENQIILAYEKLSKTYNQKYTDVAVRSSATAEDLPDASFAGQQETYLNIHNTYQLLDSVKKCFASLFTNRAIVYRKEKKFNHFAIYLSIGIQKMVRSDKGCSGVMFTIDTETGFKNAIFITSSYGLGENIVQGNVSPDEYYVFKESLKKGKESIISKKLGKKELKMIYSRGGNKTTVNIPTTEHERNSFVLTNEEIIQLGKWGQIIEDHYSHKAKHFKPMDIEWAKDGISNKLFIVQARPETVQSRKNINEMEIFKMKEKNPKIIVSGRAVGKKIGVGPARVILDVSQINKFKEGEILVTEMTDPDWVPIMKKSRAIITDRGGRTSHAAIVSRELGIPCIVGTDNATKIIKQGQMITVDCSRGEEGFVYDKEASYDITKIDTSKMKLPKTEMMINLGNPEEAFNYSFLPVNGVGLAREEFIISEHIKAHPLALLNFNKLKNPETRKKIEALTLGYKDKNEYFIEKLSQGVATIAAAFYPRKVIVRLSDFKSNEYRNLIGGDEFEPNEENPMIGFRGASRYYSEFYYDAFVLELKALKVAIDKGLDNIIIMVPFCRTIEEAKKTTAIINKHLGKIKTYVMVEIPSNVLLLEEFGNYFDGFSIGTNDLTQLTLGVDRDSSNVKVYDERNEAVRSIVKDAITKARKMKKHIGICGDAPSTYPEFMEFLIKCGIDSISLSPDIVLEGIMKAREIEDKQ